MSDQIDFTQLSLNNNDNFTVPDLSNFKISVPKIQPSGNESVDKDKESSGDDIPKNEYPAGIQDRDTVNVAHAKVPQIMKGEKKRITLDQAKADFNKEKDSLKSADDNSKFRKIAKDDNIKDNKNKPNKFRDRILKKQVQVQQYTQEAIVEDNKNKKETQDKLAKEATYGWKVSQYNIWGLIAEVALCALSFGINQWATHTNVDNGFVTGLAIYSTGLFYSSIALIITFLIRFVMFHFKGTFRKKASHTVASNKIYMWALIISTPIFALLAPRIISGFILISH